MRGTKYLVLLVAVVAALALATPLIAQEQQTDLQIQDNQGTRSVDLGSIQALGGERQSRTQGMTVRIACTPITCSQCVWLDSLQLARHLRSRRARDPAFVNTATTPDLLAKGVPYLITITGTTSYWTLSTWLPTMIGSPGAAPLFLSPAVPSAFRDTPDSTGSTCSRTRTTPTAISCRVDRCTPFIQGISLDNGATYH